MEDEGMRIRNLINILNVNDSATARHVEPVPDATARDVVEPVVDATARDIVEPVVAQHVTSQDDDDTPGDILPDINNANIYVRKIMKSSEQRTHQAKKGTRVYNTVHACLYCSRLVQHIRVHLKAKHSTQQRMVRILEEQDEIKQDKALSMMRSVGDDKHNCSIIKDGKGELLLMRRPVKDFRSGDYGPCPNCREWMLRKSIVRHQKKCIAGDGILQSKKHLLLKSDIMSGRLQTNASPLLKAEVFSIMTPDRVTEIAQGDPLIIALGESWLRCNIDNKLKRKYYSSQRMRLAARFLIALRLLEKARVDHDRQSEVTVLESEPAEVSDTGNQEEKFLWDFLVPARYDDAVKAALQVALPLMDDEEDLKAPSNAIKLKYDLIRLINAKWAFIHKDPNGNKEDGRQCEIYMRLINIDWSEKVTRLARSILTGRQYHSKREIPAPGDIHAITLHLIKQIKTTALQAESAIFRRCAILVQARLLMYNKRRSGEIDAIR